MASVIRTEEESHSETTLGIVSRARLASLCNFFNTWVVERQVLETTPSSPEQERIHRVGNHKKVRILK